ncbi:hypothetical protein [Helicobacter cappadocius]|uniref:TerC family integral membrane protein n=1 Tax=Helicobacter cappadocius TaxID=3063998 RepID=A0AA90PQQ8_9HELI|nr:MULTISPECIES: hypothetical protein [unclassified Helicobacter]MDO7253247.1 hypothetical protein [Helicobacter sp. faydin-H75]MDP2539171.1 hypothetical protein [Helicobacter sp. faydin-H76]
MEEINTIAKAFNDSVFFHSFFMYFMPVPFIINLYTLFNQRDYVRVNRKIWFVMPIIFFLIAVAFFTGIFLMAMGHFMFNAKVILMVIATVVIFVGEIVRIKRLKIAKTKEEFMIAYLKFCKVLYFIDLLLCLLLIFG